jgi:ecdysone 20-monooxygenase
MNPEASFESLTPNAEALIKKYGTLIKVELFWNLPVVIVFDVEDMDKITKVASTIRPPIEIVKIYRQSRKDRYNSVGIVNTIGPDWHVLRSVLINSLQLPKYVLKCGKICDEIADEFVQLLNGFTGENIKAFDQLLLRCIAEFSCSNVLGKRMGFLQLNVRNKMNAFITSQEKYFRALHTSFYGFPWWKYFPNKVWNELVRCEDSTYDMFKVVVEDEIKSDPKGLLKLIYDADMHELDKLVLAMDLVLGGIEPVLNSTIFTLNMITMNPQVQETLYEELKSVLPQKDSPIDADTLIQLPYLKAGINEAFRLSPTTPNLARLVESEIELQGYKIPPYTVLLCQHWHPCLQDKNFYRAKEYLPERWMVKGKRTEEFLPHRDKLYHFGYGKRDCPGRRFAFMGISICLAKVFRNFKVELEKPLEHKFEFLYAPKLPINARLTQRCN